MNRRVHFSRLLDVVSGSAFAGAKTKVQKSAIYKDFDLAKLQDARFREVITANLPIFYIVDIPLIATEIVNGLISDPKRFISKRYTPEGPVEFGEQGFQIEDIAKTEQQTRKELLADIENISDRQLRQALGSHSFSQLYSSIEKLYNTMIDRMQKQGLSYNKYRNAAINFGFSMRREMQSVGTFIATDAQQLVSLKRGQILVIQPTFDLAVRKVNESLLKPIEKLLEDKYNIVVTTNNTGFKIGNLVNAGHTSAVTSSGDIVGVNMPSAQELQFRLQGSAKSFEIDRELGQLYQDIGYQVQFTQNFSSKAQTLLDMQFAFVISQPAQLNTNKLRVDEQRRLKKIIDGELVPSLLEQLTNKLKSGIISPEELQASPTLIEYLTQQVVSQIRGMPDPQFKKTSKAKGSTKMPLPVALNTGKAKKVTAKKKVASITGLKIKTQAGVSSIPLQQLLALINGAIQQKLRQNMGDGNRKDVLNYRSGRFSESVKVERLQESRQGMITAFYTYMKNPYATFSEGGRQQQPRSRDPKSLISKSIREIAAQQVGNRMRAVLV